jgi:hypothetical protein
MSRTTGQSSWERICAAVLAFGVLFLWALNCWKSAELGGVRAELQKAQQQCAELKRAASSHSSEAERLRGENMELPRLRDEVGRLREAQQLSSNLQAQAAQGSLASAQAEQQALERVLALVRRAQGQDPQREACVENLRLIDEAKRKWGQTQFSSRLAASKTVISSQREVAVENAKVGALIPAARDIEAYFSGGVLPKCPAGGSYTLNPVNAAPTCSLPGHALPR